MAVPKKIRSKVLKKAVKKGLISKQHAYGIETRKSVMKDPMGMFDFLFFSGCLIEGGGLVYVALVASLVFFS